MQKHIGLVLVTALLMGSLYGACSWSATPPEVDDPAPPVISPTLPDDDDDDNNDDEPLIDSLWPTEKALPGTLLVSFGNNPQARPQTGLEQADIVYELLAEGGITRIMGVFATFSPEQIGPLRSMRQCMVEIAIGHASPFAHAGGSMEALAMIRQLSTKSLDEIYGAGKHFWRSNDRQPPDNLYTSAEKLLQGAQARNYGLSALPEWPTGALPGGEAATHVSISYSRTTAFPNAITYRWADGHYWREVNGAPHLSTSAEQLQPHNVLFLETITREFTRNGDPVVEIDVVGQGQALLFRDGKRYEANWEKSDVDAPFTFTLTGGELLKLTRGQTWIHLVPSLERVESDG